MANVEAPFESALRLKKLICLNSSTSFTGDAPEELKISIRRDIEYAQDLVAVILGIKVFSEGSTFTAEVTMKGEFEFAGALDSEFAKKVTEQNTVSIMFPYIRSQISLITTQPGMAPVVIPAINVNSWLASADSKDE